MLLLQLKSISKKYNGKYIFKDVSLQATNGDIIGIAGNNGAGKSTLLKIISQTTEQTSGKVIFQIDSKEISNNDMYKHIGFVSPYLNLYTEFSLLEHIELIQNFRKIKFDINKAKKLIQDFNLEGRTNSLLQEFSSGMLQRAKYILATIHSPKILFLDEPTTNLDLNGISSVQSLIDEGKENRITFVATNEQSDLDLCNKIISLHDFKN